MGSAKAGSISRKIRQRQQGSTRSTERGDARTSNPTYASALADLRVESKDYKTFLSQFISPDVLKSLTETPEGFDALVKGYPTRAGSLLTALKHARTLQPTYDQAKTTATFPLDGQPGMPPALILVKVGLYWYIGNR